MKTKEEMKAIYLKDVKEYAEYITRNAQKSGKFVEHQDAWNLDTRLFDMVIILQDLEILTYKETCEWLIDARTLCREVTGYDLHPNWTCVEYSLG